MIQSVDILDASAQQVTRRPENESEHSLEGAWPILAPQQNSKISSQLCKAYTQQRGTVSGGLDSVAPISLCHWFARQGLFGFVINQHLTSE